MQGDRPRSYLDPDPNWQQNVTGTAYPAGYWDPTPANRLCRQHGTDITYYDGFISGAVLAIQLLNDEWAESHVRAGYGRHRLRLDNCGLIGPVPPRLERHCVVGAYCSSASMAPTRSSRSNGADDLTGQHQPCPIRFQRVPGLLQDGPRGPRRVSPSLSGPRTQPASAHLRNRLPVH